MLKVYFAVTLGTFFLGDTISPIGERPVWQQIYVSATSGSQTDAVEMPHLDPSTADKSGAQPVQPKESPVVVAPVVLDEPQVPVASAQTRKSPEIQPASRNQARSDSDPFEIGYIDIGSIDEGALLTIQPQQLVRNTVRRWRKAELLMRDHHPPTMTIASHSSRISGSAEVVTPVQERAWMSKEHLPRTVTPAGLNEGSASLYPIERRREAWQRKRFGKYIVDYWALEADEKSEPEVAAVDLQQLPGVVGRRVTHQVDRKRAKVSRLTPASHRNAFAGRF